MPDQLNLRNLIPPNGAWQPGRLNRGDGGQDRSSSAHNSRGLDLFNDDRHHKSGLITGNRFP